MLLTDATRGALVQTGDGLLWLTETAWADETESTSPAESLRVGTKLGLVLQDEVAALKSRVADLESRLARLENASG